MSSPIQSSTSKVQTESLQSNNDTFDLLQEEQNSLQTPNNGNISSLISSHLENLSKNLGKNLGNIFSERFLSEIEFIKKRNNETEIKKLEIERSAAFSQQFSNVAKTSFKFMHNYGVMKFLNDVKTLNSEGKYDQVIKSVDEASFFLLKIGTKYFKSNFFLEKAIALKNLGKYEESLIVAQDGLNHGENETFCRLYLIRATCLLSIKKYKAASEAASLALQFAPFQVLSSVQDGINDQILGNIYGIRAETNLENFTNALEFIKTAVKLTAGNYTILNELKDAIDFYNSSVSPYERIFIPMLKSTNVTSSERKRPSPNDKEDVKKRKT